MRTQIIIAGICLSASLSFAVDGYNFFVQGDSSVVIGGHNTGPGTGVLGTGGDGVRGEGNQATWANRGVWGTASAGWYYNAGVEGYAPCGDWTDCYGVKGQASVPYGGYMYGLHGWVDGYGQDRYGVAVYGYSWGESDDYAGLFDGNVIVNGTFSNPSDAKFKKNVAAIGGGLDKVLALRPKSYEMRRDEYKGLINFSPGKKYGLIAQEVETVLPELVSAATVPAQRTEAEVKAHVKKDPTHFKSVDYLGLIPLLISAVQEQQAEINDLRARLEASNK